MPVTGMAERDSGVIDPDQGAFEGPGITGGFPYLSTHLLELR
jgi:hypothetical protein